MGLIRERNDMEPQPWAFLRPKDGREPMTETELEHAVRDMLEVRGLLGYHNHDSRRSTAGFPDWVIVGRRRLIWRELKSADGRTSQAQQRWIRALRDCGQDVDIWRPEDLWSERVSTELAALALSQ